MQHHKKKSIAMTSYFITLEWKKYFRSSQTKEKSKKRDELPVTFTCNWGAKNDQNERVFSISLQDHDEKWQTMECAQPISLEDFIETIKTVWENNK